MFIERGDVARVRRGLLGVGGGVRLRCVASDELELRMLESFAGAAVLHAPQVRDLDLELVDGQLRDLEFFLEALHLGTEFGVVLQGFVQGHGA